MNILLDTHLVLWCLYEPDKLPEKARKIVCDPDNWIYFSRLTLWECEIKHIKHPDVFTFSARDVSEDCHMAGYSQLNLESRHIFALNQIGEPRGIKHNDPFDRMLIAQAVADNAVFLTHDKRLGNYHIRNVVTV